MKRIIAIIALAIFSFCAMPAHANNRKIKVEAAGVVGTMEVRIATVDTATTTDTVIETVPITLAAADVMNPGTKAAKIVARINAVATNATAAVDAGDPSIVVITSNAGRSVSRVDPRPMRTTERDRLVAAVTLPETAGDAVVLGFDLEGTGSQDGGSATIDIGGTPYTVSTSSGETAGSVLLALEALIDPDPIYDADIVGSELRIFGSVLGNDYSAFVSDAGPGSAGFSYGFSLESFPVPTPEPSILALLAAAAFGGGVVRARRRSLPARVTESA